MCWKLQLSGCRAQMQSHFHGWYIHLYTNRLYHAPRGATFRTYHLKTAATSTRLCISCAANLMVPLKRPTNPSTGTLAETDGAGKRKQKKKKENQCGVMGKQQPHPSPPWDVLLL